MNQPASTPETLGVLISLVRAEIVSAIEEHLADQGADLRFVQFLILKRLALLGPMSASELARSVELDAGAMTRQLDQLEQRGYLRRRPHEQDRRALRIELTDSGRSLWQQTMGCNERALDAAQRSLSANQRKQLHDYLTRVLRALRERHTATS